MLYVEALGLAASIVGAFVGAVIGALSVGQFWDGEISARKFALILAFALLAVVLGLAGIITYASTDTI